MVNNKKSAYYVSAFHIVFFISLFFSISTFAQKSQLTGKVSDENESLIGATLQLKNSTSNIVIGTISEADGFFSFEVSPGKYFLTASFIGYQEFTKEINISENKNAPLNIILKKGISLPSAIITYDRSNGKESIKIPASISTVSSERINKIPVSGAENHLSKIHGVHVANIGIDRKEIALRGLNQPLNNELLVLNDFLPQWSASDGNFVYNAMPIPSIDLERIEIIRGGLGPTYGPGAVYGVVHFVSQSPFNSPGTSIQINSGSRNYFGTAFRHADVFGEKENWAYKLVGEFTSGNDWELDKNDPDDFQLIAGDINPRNYLSQKARLKGEVRYRFGKNKKSELINTSSYTHSKFLLTAPDAIQVNGTELFINQLRFRSGGFWVQGSVSQAFGEPSEVLRVEDPIENEKPFQLYNRNFTYGVQSQYAFDIINDRQNIIIGADFIRKKLNSKDPRKNLLNELGIEERATNYGRFENRAEATTYGAFIQSNTEIIKNKLNIISSFRLDGQQVNSNRLLPSPYLGLNYQVNSKNTFRISAQRGWTNIPLSNFYRDRELTFVRDIGNIDGFTFRRENGQPLYSFGPAVQLAFFAQINPDFGAYETSINTAHNAVLNGLEFFISSNLNNVEELERVGFLSNEWQSIFFDLFPLISPSENSLNNEELIYTLTQITGQPVSPEQLNNIAPLKDYHWDIFEFGYQGFFREKLNVNFDVFYNRAEHTQLETIVTPSISLRNSSLFNQARAVFEKNEELVGLLSSVGLSLDDWMNVYENFASAPMYIWETEENNQLINGQSELIQSTFLTPKGIDFWGLSLDLRYALRNDLNIYGSYSHLSKEQWNDEELGMPGTGFRKTMNAPPHTIKLGGSYFPEKGFSFSADAIWEDSFPFLERTFVGEIGSRFLINGSIGYDFSSYFEKIKNVQLNLSVSNIFNQPYRSFLGAPKIGRFALLSLSVGI